MKQLTSSRGALLASASMLLCTLVLAFAPAAHAATTSKSCSYGSCQKLNLSSGSQGASSGGVSATGTLVRTIIGLAIVLAVIYGLYWVMKQSRASRNPSVGYGLEQLAALPMGTNRSLALIRVGAEIHLVGVSEHGITGIRVYSEEEAYELGLPLEGPEDGLGSMRGGEPPIQRLVDTLKRFTVR